MEAGMAGKTRTALITGASSGIGAEFARQLAGDGYNLILVARRQQKMEELAADLEGKYGIKVGIATADLASQSEMEEIARLIASTPDLEMLVNNAGFGAGGYYSEIKVEPQMGMIAVHVAATARLTHAALPGMVERGSGGVINVTSVAAFMASPKSAIYCSTKTWMLAFSKAVAWELKGTGVRMQALCPGYTYTEFHDTEEFKNFKREQIPKWLWLTSERVVRDSLVALAKNKVVCIPALRYRIGAYLMQSCLEKPLVWLIARKRKH
jgi:uncharacterized protein